ncbi:hypothetical protein RF11_07847 [Thelohanellus kitauei]|uniref:Uncharacterized protein n=1 Tax=Thelohanellus kitauei TaxID=669202 RepID=A0A0C2M003_THEKT|nr:hypothetical protein RF11_07847 [Thelohanellus kitauei]
MNLIVERSRFKIIKIIGILKTIIVQVSPPNSIKKLPVSFWRQSTPRMVFLSITDIWKRRDNNYCKAICVWNSFTTIDKRLLKFLKTNGPLEQKLEKYEPENGHTKNQTVRYTWQCFGKSKNDIAKRSAEGFESPKKFCAVKIYVDDVFI